MIYDLRGRRRLAGGDRERAARRSLTEAVPEVRRRTCFEPMRFRTPTPLSLSLCLSLSLSFSSYNA